MVTAASRIATDVADETAGATRVDTGLSALCGIAAYFRIPADPTGLARELGLSEAAGPDDLLRAARLAGLKARQVQRKQRTFRKILRSNLARAGDWL